MRALMVMTSHGQLVETGQSTGLRLEQHAAPCYAFQGCGGGNHPGLTPWGPTRPSRDQATWGSRPFRRAVGSTALPFRRTSK
jgi:hypothetical protein